MADRFFNLGVLSSLFLQAVATAASSSSARVAIITPDAQSSPPLKELEGEALLQADSLHAHHAELRPPNPAAWFAGFSQGESTYDEDGKSEGRRTNPDVDVMDGWNPHQKNPLFKRARRPEWFRETKSGGMQEAWQSFSPATQASAAGNRAQTGEWFQGTGGTYEQDYLKTSSLTEQRVPASWFDASVKQLDGYGRRKFPSVGSPRNFLDWQERSVNTTLECKSPGCTANVSLLAPFDFNKEMVKNCKLSVFFRPTDFDDQYNGEHVEWIQVNNRQVSSECRPYADGCNATAQRPLLPCINEMPMDLLMPENGALTISAKIPDVVDECPYKGSMLSAVPMVTCLVALKHNDFDGAPAPTKPVSTLVENMTCVTKMPLQCATKGCAAQVAIPVNSTCAGLGQCLLSVEVTQTDFDNSDGTLEMIEYLEVDGKKAKQDLKPGKNPCKKKWSGQKLTAADMNYTALENYAVNVSSGHIVVEGKISKFVDECASDGYLLDAMATVTCSAKPGSQAKAVLVQQKDEAKVTLRRKLRGTPSQ